MRYQSLAGLARLDHGVDVTSFGGDVWIREALAKLINFLAAQRGRSDFRVRNRFSLVNDVHRAFRAHHRDFSAGPREVRCRCECASLAITQ